MKDLLSKISSYDLFNNLFPGVILIALLRDYELAQLAIDKPVMGVFIAYGVGMLASRVGSLIISPPLIRLLYGKQSKEEKQTGYKNYVLASKNDSNIVIFNEKNNTFRTLIAAMMIVSCEKLFLYDWSSFKLCQIWSPTPLLILFITGLFVASFKKQSDYIQKRIEIYLETQSNEKNSNI